MTDAPARGTISQEQQEIAELVRSGAYFEESKKWYQALYIGPIAERTFFLIVAVLAMLVGLTGIVSVVSLLPINERPALVHSNPRLDETSTLFRSLRKEHEPADEALLDFYLTSFVRAHFETWNLDEKYAFAWAHSDSLTQPAVQSWFSASNPYNPANVVANNGGKQTVRIEAVETNLLEEPKVATVKFSTEQVVNDVPTIAQWTATISFYYSGFELATLLDETSGEEHVATKDPAFKVVTYVFTPVSANAAQ